MRRDLIVTLIPVSNLDSMRPREACGRPFVVRLGAEKAILNVLRRHFGRRRCRFRRRLHQGFEIRLLHAASDIFVGDAKDAEMLFQGLDRASQLGLRPCDFFWHVEGRLQLAQLPAELSRGQISAIFARREAAIGAGWTGGSVVSPQEGGRGARSI